MYTKEDIDESRALKIVGFAHEEVKDDAIVALAE